MLTLLLRQNDLAVGDPPGQVRHVVTMLRLCGQLNISTWQAICGTLNLFGEVVAPSWVPLLMDSGQWFRRSG